jgi:hypothetical protein
MDYPAGPNGDLRVPTYRSLLPNPGGRSLMTEHTDLCKTCHYLWVIQERNRGNR